MSIFYQSVKGGIAKNNTDPKNVLTNHMLRILVLAFFSSHLAYSQIPVNNTLLNQCNANLINCTNCSRVNQTTDCLKNYNNCFSTAQHQLRSPSSCYQSAAAWICLSTAFYISMSVFAVSLIIAPITGVLTQYISSKIHCCQDLPFNQILKANMLPNSPEAPSGPIDPTIHPGQAIVIKLLGSFSTFLPTAVSVVTVGWLFTLWQAWTKADADCRFDSYLPLP